MNILTLDEIFHPNGGGAGVATYLYANLLSRLGHKVVIVTNRFEGQSVYSKSGNLEIYRLPLFTGKSVNKFAILKKLDVLGSALLTKLFKWSDVVYIPRFWYSAIPVAKFYHKRVVTHLHGYIPICPIAGNYNAATESICRYSGRFCSPKCIFLSEKRAGKGFLETLASVSMNFSLGNIFYKSIALSDAVICVSKAQQNILNQSFPLIKSKTFVVKNPLPDIPYISLEEKNCPNFAFFGGDPKIKGYDVLRQALTYIDCDIVLHATNFPESAKIHLQNGSSILKYKSVQGKEMAAIYHLSRAVIVPSICPEPAAYVVYEALLRGRILVASSVGGIPEQTKNCPGCFLFPPGDVRALSELLKYVSSLTPIDAEKLGLANREAFLKENPDFKDATCLVNVLSNFNK